MNPKENKNIDRRTFVRQAGMLAAALGTFAFGGVREAIAKASVTGKPMLTTRNVNAFILKRAQKPAQYRALMAQAKSNLSGFLNQHFTLTQQQQTNLEKLGTQEQTKINRAINGSLQTLQKDIAFFGNPAKGGPALPPPMTVSMQQSPQRSTGTEVEIEIETETTSKPDGTTSTRTSGKITIRC